MPEEERKYKDFIIETARVVNPGRVIAWHPDLANGKGRWGFLKAGRPFAEYAEESRVLNLRAQELRKIREKDPNYVAVFDQGFNKWKK